MFQDDIFKLLLLILLITNEQDNRGENGRGSSLYNSLNEIIIVSLLCNCNLFTNRCRCGDERERRDRCN